MKPLSWSRIATESEPSECTTITYLWWKEGSKIWELNHRIHVAGKGYFLLEAILIGIYMWTLIWKMCTPAIRFDVDNSADNSANNSADNYNADL